MAKASFKVLKLIYKGNEFIVIEDLNLGGMSITNYMEHALEEISDALGINMNNKHIIYKDSLGVYDAVVVTDGEINFVAMCKNDIESALDEYFRVFNLNPSAALFLPELLEEIERLIDKGLAMLPKSDDSRLVKSIQYRFHSMKDVVSRFGVLASNPSTLAASKSMLPELLWVRSSSAMIVKDMVQSKETPSYYEELEPLLKSIYVCFDNLYKENVSNL